MAVSGSGSSIEYFRAQSNLSSSPSLRPVLEGEKCLNMDGQQGGGGLHPEAGRYQKPHTVGGSSPYLAMGSYISIGFDGRVYSSGTEPVDRLPKQGIPVEQRMVSEPSSIYSPGRNLGNSRY